MDISLVTKLKTATAAIEAEPEGFSLEVLRELATLRDTLNDRIRAIVVNASSEHGVTARELAVAARVSNNTTSRWIREDEL